MDFENLDGLRTECLLARRRGYVGKVAIRPPEVPVINDVFTPSAEELAKHERIVDEFEEAVGFWTGAGWPAAGAMARSEVA